MEIWAGTHEDEVFLAALGLGAVFHRLHAMGLGGLQLHVVVVGKGAAEAGHAVDAVADGLAV